VRQQIVDAFYRSHRDAVEHDVAERIAAGAQVIHISARDRGVRESLSKLSPSSRLTSTPQVMRRP
jgi:hypothetical protein